MPKNKTRLRNQRVDHRPGTRQAYEQARRRILASQEICGICGAPVDKSLKSPHPMSATIDHIIPVSRGGDPLDPENLQLAHRICNQKKCDKIGNPYRRAMKAVDDQEVDNRNLPLSYDWKNYRAGDD